MADFRLETPRLALRSWRDDDVESFQRICSDPQVMATLGPPLDLGETAALIGRVRAIETEHGHTFWALERRADECLIGWCGVIRGNAGPIENKAEIGWRLASNCWGFGYATEAARASLDWLFANLPDDAAWAITHSHNLRSRAVMQRLGMTYCEGLDFDHPRVAVGDPLRPHVTYCLSREDWATR